MAVDSPKTPLTDLPEPVLYASDNTDRVASAQRILEALSIGVIVSRTTLTPPTTETSDDGRAWIIPGDATGVWAGRGGQVAIASTRATGGFLFSTMSLNAAGASVVVSDESNAVYEWGGTDWTRKSAGHDVLTDEATITWDMSSARSAEVTLTATRAISLQNAEPGQTYTLLVRQGESATHQITWPDGVRFAAGNPPTFSWLPYDADTITFRYDGSNFWEVGRANNLLSVGATGVAAFATLIPTVAASGQLTAAGTGSFVGLVPVQAATGTVAAAGFAAFNVPLPTSSVSGVRGQTGAVAFTVLVPIQDADANFVWTGTGATSAPLPTQSTSGSVT